MPAQLEIQIGADIRQTEQALAAVEKELRQFGREVEKAVEARGVARLNQELARTRTAAAGVRNIGAAGFDDFQTKANAARNAGFAFNQILREAPAAGINFQTFILAISNNLPIFADRIKDASRAGLSGGQIFKSLGQSLGSIPSILSLATTGLLLFGDSLFGSSSKTKEQSEALKALNKDLADSKKAIDDLGSSLQYFTQLATINIEIAGLGKVLDLQGQAIALGDEIVKAGEEITKAQKNLIKAYNQNVEEGTEDSKAAFDEAQSNLDAAFKKEADLRNQQNIIFRQNAAQRRKDQKQAADDYNKYVQDTIRRAKELADFFDRITIRDIDFDIDPRDSLETSFKRAKVFIDRVLNRRDTFRFKPVVFVEPATFQNLEASFAKLNEELRKNAIKDLEEVQKEVNRLTSSNPILIQAKLFTDTNEARGKEYFSALGIEQGISLLTDLQKQTVFAANAIRGVLTPAFQNLFAAIVSGEAPMKAFFNSIGQAILQLIQKLIAAAIAALVLSALLPKGINVGGKSIKGFGGFFSNIMGFAAGGVVYGPTLGMIGEGVGTSKTNPEIVAPLDQLKKHLQPLQQGGGGNMRVRIQGRDLVLVQARERRAQRRATGRG